MYIIGRKKKSEILINKTENDYYVGRISSVPQSLQRVNNTYSKTADLLNQINNANNMVDAIDLIIENTPDGKMAYNTYIRLANQGFNVSFKNATTGRTVKKYDEQWRTFCANASKNNATGMDGIVDQLVGSSIARGGMAVELVVDKKMKSLDVVVVDPATISEFIWIDSEQRYSAIQNQSGGKKVDLYTGNFFFVPHQPKAGHPEGTLQFAPAVTTSTQYLKLLNDSLEVIERIGYPRFDIAIDRKSFMDSLVDKSPDAIKEAYQNLFQQVKSSAIALQHKSDFVHFDEVKIETIGGGVNGAGIDVRAWFQALDPLIANSFQLTPVMLGRLSGGSYSLGTVEFKIITDTVDSMRRSYKRILENIAQMWARINGFSITPTVTLNPIDWEKEKDKLEAELLKLQICRRAEEYGYISKDTAAIISMNQEKSDNSNSDGMFEYLNALSIEQNGNNTE